MEQRPAILNGTVRENIAFSRQLPVGVVDAAIDASALRHDVLRMAAGADTEIGERGVNLSGGQKARLAFARVLAARDVADVVLLDDPFASVDVHVARQMFCEGVQRHLAGRTRLVVMSSHTEFLRRADLIITVADGKVQSVLPPGLSEAILHPDHPADVGQEAAVTNSKATGVTGVATGTAEAASGDSAAAATAGTQDGTLTNVEGRTRGAVSLQLYRWYFEHASGRWSGAIITIILGVYMLGQAVRVMGDIWIVWWSDETPMDIPAFLPRSQEDPYWVRTVGAWLVANVFVAFARAIFCALVATWSSAGVHSAALANTLQAPLLFFQQNPLGRILNRFSTDLHRVDMLLPQMLFQLLNNLFILGASLILASISVPWVLLAVPFLVLAYYRIMRLYRSCAREMLRLDSVCKSPMYSHFGQSLATRVTARAFAVQATFIAQQRQLTDTHLAVFLSMKLMERWVSLFMNLVAALITATLAFVGVAIRGQADPVLFGLALVYALQLMGLSSWTVKTFVELESSMTCFERLEEYRTTPAEIEPGCDMVTSVEHGGHKRDDASSKGTDVLLPCSTPSQVSPDADWPSRGAIVIQDLSLRYRAHLRPAIEHLTVSFGAGEKIGVCGRTGAGKSSIIMALFRMFVPEGRIFIDGIDVSRIPLQLLRSKLAIIPQDPVLFSGSVRYNLDPFGQHTDTALWQALERVQLKTAIAELAQGLSQEVVAGGSCRLSQGQGQLICVARALLKGCRILLLDEATSSIDRATDAVVQEVIRSAFAHCTVLTIAHRIDTIMDSDKVLVMDGGRMAEFAPPLSLLARPGSLFSRLAQTTSSHRRPVVIKKPHGGNSCTSIV